MNTSKSLLIFIFLFSFNAFIQAQLRLPKLIGDGLVLQRDAKIPIWGWASANENITVNFNGKKYKAKSSTDGQWQLKLEEMEAGGPYAMIISGEHSTLQIKDILIGDVWLCTGQSNMVHQLNIHDVLYANEIATANYSEIRHFKIPSTPAISGPREDIEGGEWQKAVGEQVRPFSAVAYFFAKKIYKKYGIPIGIINASVGGTPIEAWIPEEGYKEYPDILKIISENKDSTFVNKHQKKNVEPNENPSKIQDKGLLAEIPWYDVDFIPNNWRRINIPGYWEDQGAEDLDGVVWYRRQIDIPKSMVGKSARVYLGRIVDADELYINGVMVGSKTYQYPQRRYEVPENILTAGTNTFVVRVTNKSGKGGFVPDKPYYLFTENDTVDLKGYWQYKVGQVYSTTTIPKPEDGNSKTPETRQIHPQNEPSALYNGMVSPYTDFALKGILWYQGESNAGEPEKYEGYMRALVLGLREVFNRAELPFIYAQLPNFMDVSYVPTESNWAELREAQSKALSIPNTAMTVNIDLGEWNDIHPDNKKDVGERMALAALKLVYHEDVVYSGPTYESHVFRNNKVTVTFTNTGSGLTTNDGEALSEFSIAGEDKNFIWAKASIQGNKVTVWSDEVLVPKYVRYAWANNPDNPNLYNKEGLPASPFRIK